MQQILTQELEKLRDDILAKQKAAGQPADESAYTCRVTSDGKGVLEYAAPRATKPGKQLNDILARWAAAKGLKFKNEKQFNHWAYAMSRKIEKEGMDLYLPKNNADAGIDNALLDEFEQRLAEHAATYYQQKINNELF
jgi:hypothetical protein